MFTALLLWARANPKIVAWLVGSAIVLVLVLLVYAMVYNKGANSVWTKVNEQNREAHRAADEVGFSVDECYKRDGMRWSVARGKCERTAGDTR